MSSRPRDTTDGSPMPAPDRRPLGHARTALRLAPAGAALALLAACTQSGDFGRVRLALGITFSGHVWR